MCTRAIAARCTSGTKDGFSSIDGDYVMETILTLADLYANRATRVGSCPVYDEALTMLEGAARDALEQAVVKLEADIHVLALAVVGLIAENYPHTLTPDNDVFLESIALVEGEMDNVMPDDYDPFSHAKGVMLAARERAISHSAGGASVMAGKKLAF